MHPAATAQFDRLVTEYQSWLMVPENDRSPAPGWWWGPAIAWRTMPGDLPDGYAQRLGLRDGAGHADAAQLFLDALAGQIHLAWPEQFPGNRRTMRDAAENA